jgi:hypothetical protein
MQKYLLNLLIVVTLVVIGVASAEAKEARVTGVFSDLHFVPEAGDVSGMEVFIIYTNEGYYALVQFAEGTLLVPVVVPVKVDKSSVRFTVPLPTGAKRQFLGVVTEEGLLGKFENAGGKFNLKRGKSYWQ